MREIGEYLSWIATVNYCYYCELLLITSIPWGTTCYYVWYNYLLFTCCIPTTLLEARSLISELNSTDSKVMPTNIFITKMFYCRSSKESAKKEFRTNSVNIFWSCPKLIASALSLSLVFKQQLLIKSNFVAREFVCHTIHFLLLLHAMVFQRIRVTRKNTWQKKLFVKGKCGVKK